MGKRTKSGPFDFPTKVEDAKARARAIALLKDKGVRLPTFAELAQPDLIAQATCSGALGKVGPDDPHPLNLHRVHWFNDLARTGRVATPVHVELPAALTGVEARIVVVLGALFPMIRAHKVLAAYACLAPRLVSGRFDPTRAARGVALDRQLLPRRRRHLQDPGLPRRRRAARGHEPGAVRLARPMGERARGHRAHAGHGVQRQGDLRQVRRAGARWRQRDRQPVQRVRQLPGALALHRAGARERVRGAAQEVARPEAGGLRLGQRLGRHAGGRRLPQGAGTAPASPWWRPSSARRCS